MIAPDEVSVESIGLAVLASEVAPKISLPPECFAGSIVNLIDPAPAWGVLEAPVGAVADWVVLDPDAGGVPPVPAALEDDALVLLLELAPLLDDELLPQAANRLPATGTEMPMAAARFSNVRRDNS